ncbi:glycosyltransferase family 4 protein [Pleurocapsales cyanobacterium LEGE 10410]|nr:glycosyltransferase family 4 protein [Pleurocapsales cyanobacterium LEGE 10410]
MHQPIVSNQHKSAGILKSDSTVKVLTPPVYPLENNYITCLWSSVRSYGVEIEEIELPAIVNRLKTNQKTGDVFHLHWIDRYYSFAPNRIAQSLWSTLKNLRHLFWLKSQGYQLVWTVHNTFSHNCNTPLLERSFRWILSCLCNDVIVMGEHSRREFAQMYGRTHRVHIVPHGNYIGAYPNQICRTEARQRLGIAPHKTVLLHFGKIKPYKGIKQLIVAFNKLEDPEAVLLIAGLCRDRQFLTEIEQAIAADPRIILRPYFIEDEDVQVYMNTADWVTLPYQKILNSGTALLALSFGRPVIVPRQGSLTELITDGEHGFCYSRDDELVAALNRALATPPECWQQMCAQAYAQAQEYDWKDIGAQLYQIYQQET